MAKHAYLHRSIDVKFIFHSARLGLFSSANILNSDSPQNVTDDTYNAKEYRSD